MSSALALFTSLLAASSALAHCQLAWPYPLHSPLNPDTPEAIKDYSMTSPLITDGTYPCKGFISSDMSSVATWSAGSTYNYTVVGTATHGGGSCQLSMSYDSGATWSVIFSQIGGCLVDGMTTEFPLPADAPSGEALFAWGWFNLLGNREMYHNCAPVTITGGGAGLSGDDYPTPFVANADVNECVTIENIEVVFPNPGKNVKYGGSYAGSQPTEPVGFTGSNCVAPGASSGGSSSGSGSSSASASETASATSSAAAGVSISAGVSVGVSVGGSDAASTTATATASASTTSSATTAPVNNAAVGDGSSSSTSASASASTSTTGSSGSSSCKRKRGLRSRQRRSDAHGHLIPRGGRVAAQQATHPNASSKRDSGSKRVAASKATHPGAAEKRDGGKRVAASKATHPGAAEKRGESGRVAASKATHPNAAAGKRGEIRGRGAMFSGSA
ncbi:hypothetical protein IAT38_002150 [Cryptococcus sp. DSM 104549]